MGKLVDFDCAYEDTVGVSSNVTERLDLTYPDAYLHWDTMAEIAREIRKKEGAAFCVLPFCHTLEAEAMGGNVDLGNGTAGPRAKGYICETPEQLLALPSIDFEKGRIQETLKACGYLREKGETVALMVSGPFTILNVLMDPRHVFRAMKKQPEKMQQVFDRSAKELLRFIERAVAYHVDIISYGDPCGGLNILGPKYTRYMAEHFTYPFLKRAEKIAAGRTQIFLCPKTSFALLGADKMRWVPIPVDGPMQYVDAVLSAKGQIVLAGQMCIKNRSYTVQKEVKAVQLL